MKKLIGVKCGAAMVHGAYQPMPSLENRQHSALYNSGHIRTHDFDLGSQQQGLLGMGKVCVW
jgi:hypothetical protein